MTEFETFATLHGELRKLHDKHKGIPEIEHIRAQVWGLLQNARYWAEVPLVFDMNHASQTGTLEVGRFGREKLLPDPCLGGLLAAWKILAHGSGNQGLHAVDLLENPGTTPGPTLRMALTRAAKWAEEVADCPDLARAIRSIKAHNDGRITVGRLPVMHFMV